MSGTAPKQRVLVVSADTTLRDRLLEALAGCGGDHLEAESVDAARAIVARADGPDLAVVDLDLAGSLALCEELATARPSAVPLLAIARAEDPALVRAASLCCDVVEKPACREVLARRVSHALDYLRTRRELGETSGRLAVAQTIARLGSFEIDWVARDVRLSEEARRIYGIATAEARLDDLETLVAPAQRDAWRAWLAECAAGEPVRPVEHRLFRQDQTERVVRVHVERRIDARDGCVLLESMVHDVTDRRRVEEELEYQALHDELTGLGNRRQLTEELERALEEARREERLVAVLFLDLDRFKDVNESLGHVAGDRLLVTISERLRECLREVDAKAHLGNHSADAIARPGGDEFAVVLSGLCDRGEAGRVAQRILDVLARPFLIDDREIYLTTCIGISTWPTHGASPHELVRNAETALYQAKERAPASFVFYERSMDHAAAERLAVQSALRRALERRDLEVWYQPRIELSSSRIVGMEALVRWQHPTRGLVTPSEFIPIAEECGLIVPVGNFVLREACAQARRWHETGFPDLRIAINVSAEQLRDAGFPDAVERIAQESGLTAEHVELELTESALMRDVDRALELLLRLKRKGFHVSIDDFGTGYSSLAYLKRFPIDCLKIDCSFVRDVTTDAGDAAITAAILFMAHSLKLDVVAEGVETQEQLDFLRCHRCDQVQGFYFSAALPAAAATAILEKQVVEPLEPIEPIGP